MGGEKTQTRTESQSAATATPEETELNRLTLDRIKANRPEQLALDKNLYGSMNTILQGGNLPGNLNSITGITPQQTQDMVNASLRDIYPQFQTGGIMDSGMAAQIASRTSADVRNQNAQFNVGAISQLFNQALGGGSNLGSSYGNQTGQLGSQLAGLRTLNSSGSSTTIGMNPFLKSFQTSLGSSLGSGSFGSGGGAASGAQGAAGGGSIGAAAGFCWVASEIFGGWYHPKTVMARFFIQNIGPKWFKELYIKHGEKVAEFISDKPALKLALLPLFEMFVLIAERQSGYCNIKGATK